MAFIGPNDSLDMLLIGRTGDGKSETANTILGSHQFPTSSNAGSLTIQAQFDWCHFEGNDLKVVDCPGLGDTRLGVKDDVQQFVDAIKVAIANNPKGYHAFLYVLKFGNKFTKVDELNVFTLKALFGNDFIKDHGILVMTYGDCFESEPTVKSNHYSFDQWLRMQDNLLFQNLIRECNYRAVLFDNRTDDTDNKIAQVRKLVEIVLTVSRFGKRYTNQDFEQVEKKRNELLLNLGKEQEKQDVIDRIGTLISKIKNATDNEKGSETLLAVSQDVANLNVFVKKAVVQNPSLKTTLSLVDNLRDALQAKTNQVATIIAFTGLLRGKRKEYDEVMDEFQRRQASGTTDEGVASLPSKKLKKKEEADKEKELNNIEREIHRIDVQFKNSREHDLKETYIKIEQLESRYVNEKNGHATPIIPKLMDYMRNMFSIRVLFDKIRSFFR